MTLTHRTTQQETQNLPDTLEEPKKTSPNIVNDIARNISNIVSPISIWIEKTRSNTKRQNLNFVQEKYNTGELFVMMLTIMVCLSLFSGDLFGPDIFYPLLGLLSWRSFSSLTPLKSQVDKLDTINRSYQTQLDKQCNDNSKLLDNIVKLESIREALEHVSNKNNDEYSRCLEQFSSEAMKLNEQIKILKEQTLLYTLQNNRYSNLLKEHSGDNESLDTKSASPEF